MKVILVDDDQYGIILAALANFVDGSWDEDCWFSPADVRRAASDVIKLGNQRADLIVSFEGGVNEDTRHNVFGNFVGYVVDVTMKNGTSFVGVCTAVTSDNISLDLTNDNGDPTGIVVKVESDAVSHILIYDED